MLVIIFESLVFFFDFVLIIVCMVVFVFGKFVMSVVFILLMFCLISFWLLLCLVFVMLFVIMEVSRELIVFKVVSVKLNFIIMLMVLRFV